METRSSPSMHELRVIAHERGLKYYMHLSKPELFALLQRKQGGGTGAPLLSTATAAPPSSSSSSLSHSTTTATTASAATTASLDAAKKRDGKGDSATDLAPGSTHSDSSTDARPSARVSASTRASATRSSLRLSTLKRKCEDDTDAVDRQTNTTTAATSKKSKKSKKQKTAAATNALDPIMMCELGPHTFTFVRTNGSVVVYNVESLVQYILATGDFSEPQTRIPFSEANLRQIDHEAKVAKLGLKSVWDAKMNKHEFDEQKVKRDGILGLERCAGEFVAKMLEVVESDDSEEGEMMLIMSLFPSFSDIYGQIRSSDKEYARQCMNHFKAYLRGPKNRPTVDSSGLLPVILGFLDDVSKGEQSASAFGF